MKQISNGLLSTLTEVQLNYNDFIIRTFKRRPKLFLIYKSGKPTRYLMESHFREIFFFKRQVSL